MINSLIINYQSIVLFVLSFKLWLFQWWRHPSLSHPCCVRSCWTLGGRWSSSCCSASCSTICTRNPPLARCQQGTWYSLWVNNVLLCQGVHVLKKWKMKQGCDGTTIWVYIKRKKNSSFFSIPFWETSDPAAHSPGFTLSLNIPIRKAKLMSLKPLWTGTNSELSTSSDFFVLVLVLHVFTTWICWILNSNYPPNVSCHVSGLRSQFYILFNTL